MKCKSFLKIFIPLAIVEFSIIISSFWMLGDYDVKRFNQWSISEWMINYQGGFVRRGLIGEILHQFKFSGGVIPVLYLIVLGLYCIYISIFIANYLVSKINSTTVLILAILIPGGIFHMAMGVSFYTRKEILFLIHFGILCLLYQMICRSTQNHRSIWIALYGTLVIIGGICLTLVHEAYLFMAYPITLFLCLILRSENKDSQLAGIIPFLYALVIPIIFLICSVNHGDQITSQAIWDSYQLSDRLILASKAPYTSSYATAGIGWGLMQHLSTIYGVFITGTWAYWIFFWLVNGCVLVSIASRISLERIPSIDYAKDDDVVIKKRIVFVASIAFGFLISSSMFFIASDYGRWIACASNLTLLLSFSIQESPYLMRLSDRLQNNYIYIFKRLLQIAISPILLFTLLLYEVIFQMPECCLGGSEFLMRYDKFLFLFIK